MENVQEILLNDRISNLPKNVEETILMCLPVRDAVRTSILSRKWRHVWSKLPQFVFDQTFWENVSEHSSADTLMKIIYQLLLRHDGPINKFTLSNPQLTSCMVIDDLIYFLSRSHLEDFTLEMWKDSYLLPYSFFSCEKLKHLRLRSCTIRSFPVSKGFSRLTSLKLIEVTIGLETLSSLILGSPLLGVLEIESSSEINICIDAPNLRTFTVNGLINSIYFKSVPVLAFVSILSTSYYSIVNFGGVEGNIANFFSCFRALETLQLSFHVVQGFANNIQKRLPISLVHLTDIKLSKISFNIMCELCFTLCLLRSSPILRYIEILFEDLAESNSESTTTYMEEEDFSDICLSELMEVKLNLVEGTRPELEFIRLLLAKSLNLKKIQIQPKEGVADNGFSILKEVTKFRRISKDAEIMFAE